MCMKVTRLLNQCTGILVLTIWIVIAPAQAQEKSIKNDRF
jgi:hypothetical protein